jgi:hypothetical protein
LRWSLIQAMGACEVEIAEIPKSKVMSDFGTRRAMKSSRVVGPLHAKTIATATTTYSGDEYRMHGYARLVRHLDNRNETSSTYTTNMEPERT